MLRRLVQAYLATGRTVEGLVEDVPLEWADAERVRFVTSNLVEAAAPSNNPLISPVGWKAAIDTAGGNVVAGPGISSATWPPPGSPRWWTPMPTRWGRTWRSRRAPSSSARRCSSLSSTGRDAGGPRPAAAGVPPTINKYYILDLAPGRSLVEYLVEQGMQVFVCRWRNPDARHSGGAETYVQAISRHWTPWRTSAASTARTSSRPARAASSRAWRRRTWPPRAGEHRLASLDLLVTLLDQTLAGVASAKVDEPVAARAVAASRRTGYLDGRLAEVFAWLRPGDLVWNYWVTTTSRAGNRRSSTSSTGTPTRRG